MTSLLLPNFYNDYQTGLKDGQAQQFSRLAGLAISDPTQRTSALGQAAALNPVGAVNIGGALQNQQIAQEKDQQAQQQAKFKRVIGMSQAMLDAYKSGDPARIQGTYEAAKPILSDFSGQQPPDQFSPDMLPHIYKVLGMAGGEPADPKLTVVGANSAALGPDGKPVFTNTVPDKLPQELATIKALQADPSLLSTYRQMHPQKPESSGDSGMELLTPDGKALMDASIAHGYNMPMPNMGYGKAGTAAKAAAINSLAARFKNAGRSPDEAISLMIQGKTATTGLTGLQRTFANVSGWEHSAAKQADIALEMSGKVDRTGAPIFNHWLLAGRQGTGSVEVAQFNNTVNTLAEEYAKVIGGGNATATDSTRALAHDMLNSAMTQDQFAGVVAKMRQEMATRTQALQEVVSSQRGSITGNDGANMGGWGGAQSAAPTQEAQAPQQPAQPGQPKMLRYNPATGRIE